MNRWSRWLAAAPAVAQRLIARTHRMSLPRAGPAAERLRRLRRALCTPAAVRAVYAALDADVRAALDELRGARPGAAGRGSSQPRSSRRSATERGCGSRARWRQGRTAP